MVTVVIAAHGELAEALVHTASMIFGNMEDVASVTFKPGEGVENLLNKYSVIIPDTQKDVLFLVDLLGGSPYNAASRFVADKKNMDIVSGVNLPMLVEVLGKRLGGSDLKAMVQTAKKAGVDGIQAFHEWFDEQQMVNSTRAEEGDELG
ncbi:PTS sugar transporter subunit IIA [Sporolactobacillus spathodeae]|uniref:PTS system mannose-specific IIA component/PTS system mannose-specific IIB component n=1 Tax=Sporolactobacillus spathodeae TaxID=1465502 RepID=A0ABS2Q9E4_9BACL|nr:mannose/fructose/sorbose PTS transporter subunit IIA [Sporolactobacillus spathodeae]MBM7658065.1 PTS system mannose-specific IIA component/PTS system mannose-specific IIB component [Sporolactobacillus spathodeae]